MLVGEIGISSGQFYYGLRWWEMQAIIRGYNRRERGMWSATRWQTYYLMSVSMADLKKAGINKPTDLMKFPWEKEADIPTISDDEIAELQAEMEALNEYYAQEQVSP